MNVEKLQKGIEKLKKELGASLLATDIWKSGVGTSLASYNSNPEGAALFDRATDYLKKTLETAGFPELDDYYLVELKNNKLIVIMVFPEGFQWGILADKEKLNMGMLLSIAIPQAKKYFYDAYQSED